MKPFDYIKYVSNKTLLREFSEDKPSAEEFDYMDRDQLGTHNDPLGPNENEEEEYEEDLFDDWENLPEEPKELYLKWSSVLGGDDGEYEGMDRYKMMQVMQDEFENIGYTFDWGLDAEPYGLKKMDSEKGVDEAEIHYNHDQVQDDATDSRKIAEIYNTSDLESIIADIESHIRTSSVFSTEFKHVMLDDIYNITDLLADEDYEELEYALEEMRDEMMRKHAIEYKEAYEDFFEQAISIAKNANENSDDDDEYYNDDDRFNA